MITRNAMSSTAAAYRLSNKLPYNSNFVDKFCQWSRLAINVVHKMPYTQGHRTNAGWCREAKNIIIDFFQLAHLSKVLQHLPGMGLRGA